MDIKLFPGKKKRAEFEQLASACERQVYSLCCHMMGNRDDALDCAQETMLRAFRAFGSFRREASFQTWITRIAINACNDALRKRRPAVSLEALREESGFDAADPAPTAYAQLEQKERMRLLREGLAQLPEDMRRLIILRDMQGMRYDEIAEALDIPLGTVKSRVSRARDRLTGLLQKSSELFSSHSV